MLKRFAIQTSLLLITAGAAQGAPSLWLGPDKDDGGIVTIPVTLTNEEGLGIAAVGLDIGYDTEALENPAAVVGPAAVAAGKSISVSTPSSGMVRLGVFGLNTTAIGNGAVVVVTFKRKPGGGAGPLQFKYVASAANPAGDSVPINKEDSVLTIK
jgi:hypothetical protein